MRKHYIDNLRWLTVLLLFPYHTFMIYNTFGESFYVKGVGIAALSEAIGLTWPWIMPLMFTIAGISSAYALKRRTSGEYLKERALRLLVPLVFGILLLIPAQTYFAERFHNGYTGGYFEQYGLFFTKPTDLTGYAGGFTPGQLWFILYLLIISLLALPIMRAYEKSPKKLPVEKLSLPILVSLFIIPFACQIILDISGKSVGEYFAFFMLGYLVLSDEAVQQKLERRCFALVAMAIGGLLALLFWGNAINETSGILYDVITEAYAMIAILALLGLARRYLNVQNNATRFFSSSSFGVYVFHQSWIIAAAYYVFGFTQAPAVQIALILLLSVPLTFLTCAIFRRFRITRFMFGLKE